MLPMRLFGRRGFAAVNVAALMMFFGMFGTIFLLSQFLQTAQGYPARGRPAHAALDRDAVLIAPWPAR